MKNLVSKNPVQRFKQGQKVQKMFFGSVVPFVMRPLYKKTYNLIGGAIDEIKKGPVPEIKLFSGNGVEDTARAIAGGNKGPRKVTTPQKENITDFNEKNIKRDIPVDNYYIKGFGKRKDEISKLGGVRAIQQKLKNLKLLNSKVDGKWGNDTEEAYKKYLVISNTDFTPASNEPIEILNNENNNVNFDYEKFRRAALASDYTPDLVEQKLVTSTPIIYNRSMTRDWLRNNIGTAYGVSAAIRAAARRKLNGQATNDDIMLIKSNQKLYDALKNAGLFKKGGQLPSRNIIERFKNKI